MNTEPNDLTIGDLLKRFDLITPYQLSRGSSVSECTGLPIGKALVVTGNLPERILLAVVEAQSLLRDDAINLEQAAQAMDIVRWRERTFAEALGALRIDVKQGQRNRLGEMLVESGMLSNDQLDFGLTVSESSGLPLGQVLVLLNRISEGLLRLALALQRELRAHTMLREQAIRRLKIGMSESETLDKIGIVPPHKVRIGSILAAAGLVSTNDLSCAVRSAGKTKQLLGQYLVKYNVVSAELLNLSLHLQSLVWQGRIKYETAVNLLKNASKHTTPTISAQSTKEPLMLDRNTPCTFYKFLRISGYINDEKVEQLVSAVAKDKKLEDLVYPDDFDRDSARTPPLREDVIKSMDDPAVLRYALNIISPVDQRLVNTALILFTLSATHSISLAQALVSFGVKWNNRSFDLLATA
ncbi:MAG: hypothetical protein K2X93_02830 [Candidatus Obscuribacterales bacterium]|nr:hypothetical protein [Candidatus Obscuribacterales bacterium]